MKTIVSLFLSLATVLPVSAQEQIDSVARDSVKTQTWLAAIETIGYNVGLAAYNNVALSSSPFSKITFKSMKRNIKEFKWWWDEDYMYTNTFEHPYQGSVYYLTARENGHSIGTSTLFSVGGCLMWELFGEAEKPSYNDMLTTPVGGVTIGEPLHRISSAIVDERTRGMERVGREFLAFVVNPMCGLNRLLRGDSWRVRGGRKAEHQLSSTLSAGYRHLTVREQPNVTTAYLHWNTTYGDIMGAEGNGLFDFFDLDFTAALGSHQTILNYTRVTTQLWCSESISTEQNWGFYNHLYHLYAEPYYATGDSRKFRNCIGYSECGSVGPGYAYRKVTPRMRWEQQFIVNGILLGTTPMKLVNREHPQVGYTWGSGYGAKVYSRLQVDDWLNIGFEVDFSQLFTWVGYECKNATNLKTVRKADIQGEAGNSLTLIVSPTVDMWLSRRVGLELRSRYLWHKFNYLYHQHTTLDYAEVLAGLVVKI